MLFMVAQIAHTFPPLVLIIVCILLCIPGAVSLISIAIMRKTIRSKYLQEGGTLAFFNKGKVLIITGFFLISLVTTFAVFLEMPTWRFHQWLAVLLLLPVYFIVFKRTSSFLGKEIKGFSLEAHKLLWCAVIVPILMCIIYVVSLFLLMPRTEYSDIQAAFLAHQNILAYSPSAFVANIAALTSLFNAFFHYVIGVFSGEFPFAQVLWYLALYWAIFFNLTNMLNFFMISPAQRRRIFIPLTADELPAAETPIQKKYVVLPIFLAVFTIVSFMVLDHQVKQQINTPGHFTRIQIFIRSRIEIVAVRIDGQYYELHSTLALIRQAEIDAENLREEALREIVPSIDLFFDGLIANVDDYLDFHYSLFADGMRFLGFLGSLLPGGGGPEAFLANQMTEHLTRDVDEEWVRKLEAFESRVVQNIDGLQEQLPRLRVNPAVPAWLVQTRGSMNMQEIVAQLQPEEIMGFRTRFAISAGTGIAVGVIGTVLARTIVLTKVRTTGIKIGSVAAAKAVGWAAGPLGALAAGAVALGINYALLRADEAANRESFRSEIVEAIEQQRAEALRALEPGTEAPAVV